MNESEMDTPYFAIPPTVTIAATMLVFTERFCHESRPSWTVLFITPMYPAIWQVPEKFRLDLAGLFCKSDRASRPTDRVYLTFPKIRGHTG